MKNFYLFLLIYSIVLISLNYYLYIFLKKIQFAKFIKNFFIYFFSSVILIYFLDFYVLKFFRHGFPSSVIQEKYQRAPSPYDTFSGAPYYKDHNFYDFQGSTWAPHLIQKDLWNKIGGFSEEFFPGTGSDPDLNMKLWKSGVRIFKGVNNCKVYHFGSIVTRKYKNNKNIITESGSKGGKIFILKWGFSIKFFKKYFMNSDTKYIGPLNEPKRDFMFMVNFFLNKLNYLYLKYIYRLNNKIKFTNK